MSQGSRLVAVAVALLVGSCAGRGSSPTPSPRVPAAILAPIHLVRAAPPTRPAAEVRVEAVPALVQAPWSEAEAEPAPGTTRDPVSRQGQEARGIYISGPFVRHVGVKRLLRNMRRSSLNAAVIDLKDDDGRVTYDTGIEILEPSVRPFLGDAAALVAQFEERGIYTIARIVCFADPALPRAHHDRAIIDSRPRYRGGPWVSWGTGTTWLDPYNEDNHDLIVALAREAESLGFDEVQLDYVRFPVDDGIEYAVFPAQDERTHSEVLVDLLRRVDEAIAIPLGVDVFGLTAFNFGRHEVLGQDLEAWAEHVEVISPMLYVNAMPGWAEGTPGRERFLIRTGISQLRERIGPEPIIRPYLQSFPAGTDRYDWRFFLGQIRGAREGGADGFLFWHSGSRYQRLHETLQGPIGNILQFPIDERAEARREAWGLDDVDCSSKDPSTQPAEL